MNVIKYTSLLCVNLSGVTDLQGLFIISNNDDLTFYHSQKTTDSAKHLRDGFKRLPYRNISYNNIL